MTEYKQLNITDECIKQGLIEVGHNNCTSSDTDIINYCYEFGQVFVKNGKHELLKSYRSISKYYNSLDIPKIGNTSLTHFVKYILKNYVWAMRYVKAYAVRPKIGHTFRPLCMPEVTSLSEFGELFVIPMYTVGKERDKYQELIKDCIFVAVSEGLSEDYLNGYKLFIKPNKKLKKYIIENRFNLIKNLGSFHVTVQEDGFSVLIAESSCLIGENYVTCIENNTLMHEVSSAVTKFKSEEQVLDK